MNKYHNKHCEYLGIKFDSEMELNYYKYLISKGYSTIEIHPKFEIQPAFIYHCQKIRKIEYEADFRYGLDVIDIKGFETTDFKIKAKMFKYRYPMLNLKLITYCKKLGGWIELEELKKKRKSSKKAL